MVEIDHFAISGKKKTYQDEFNSLSPGRQEVIIDEEISRANSIAEAIDRIIASWSDKSHQEIADLLI